MAAVKAWNDRAGNFFGSGLTPTASGPVFRWRPPRVVRVPDCPVAGRVTLRTAPCCAFAVRRSFPKPADPARGVHGAAWRRSGPSRASLSAPARSLPPD